MSVTRTITLSKTAYTPENAFDLYPDPLEVMPVEYAEFAKAFNVERTVEKTADSIIVRLTYPSIEFCNSVVDTNETYIACKALKDLWVIDNHIIETKVLESND